MAINSRRWLGLAIIFAVVALLVAIVALGKDEFARARFESKLQNVHEHTGTIGSAKVHLFERRLVFYDIVFDRVGAPSTSRFWSSIGWRSTSAGRWSARNPRPT